MSLQSLKTNWLRVAVHIGAWIPAGVMIWAALTNQLGAEPISEIILRTGKTALVLLVLSLACTPANTLLGFKPALKVRRALGLYAFFYALAHLTMFVGVDYLFDVVLLADAILEKPYALVGAAAFLVLLPLALTSTKASMKRLGQTWNKLHRAVYLAAILVIVHFVWLVKLDVREPLIFGASIAFLLALRIHFIRRFIAHWRGRIGNTLKPARSNATKQSFHH